MISNIGKLTMRFVIPTSALILVISIVFLWLLARVSRDNLESALKEKGHSLAENLAYNSELGVIAGQREKLHELTEGVLQQEDVLYVTVSDERDMNLSSSTKPDAGLQQPEPAAYEVTAPVLTTKKQLTREEIGLEAVAPVSEKESERTTRIGTVRIGLSTEGISQKVRHFILIMAAAMIACILAIVLVVGLTIHRVVLRPTRRLADSMQKVADGQLSVRVEMPGNDEIAQLARSFNTMALSIEEARSGLEQKVEERTMELRLAIKDLESFSYSVSHDLRAPLRAIDGFSRLLQEESSDRLGEEGKRFLNIIRTSTKNMGQLIDDLLAFSRLGRQDIKVSTIDMQDLANQVFQEVRSAHPQRQMELRMNSLPAAPGDRAMIRQVFVNLISNAAKFTQTREAAVIDISGRPEGREIAYEIKDNGVGFNKKYKAKLFGVFQRLHTTDEFEGTGVGLAIVQRVIHRHGGRVWADSELDAGAIFGFSLPLKGGEYERN